MSKNKTEFFNLVKVNLPRKMLPLLRKGEYGVCKTQNRITLSSKQKYKIYADKSKEHYQPLKTKI
jgi:hypothetical protein